MLFTFCAFLDHTLPLNRAQNNSVDKSVHFVVIEEEYDQIFSVIRLHSPVPRNFQEKYKSHANFTFG